MMYMDTEIMGFLLPNGNLFKCWWKNTKVIIKNVTNFHRAFKMSAPKTKMNHC